MFKFSLPDLFKNILALLNALGVRLVILAEMPVGIDGKLPILSSNFNQNWIYFSLFFLYKISCISIQRFPNCFRHTIGRAAVSKLVPQTCYSMGSGKLQV